MEKKFSEIPIFTSEDEEREFWARNDSTTYIDRDGADLVTLPNLEPTIRTVSLYHPEPTSGADSGQ